MEGAAPALRLRRRQVSGWALATAAVAALVALPVAGILASLAVPAFDTWAHLARTTLPEIAVNTVGLALAVGLGTAVVGVATAWLVTMCRFPGVRWFEWALLLPLAMPGYLSAIAWADLMVFAGPLQSALRGWTGWRHGDYWFPDIQTPLGVAAVLTFVLYPYVYLIARASFLAQSLCVLEAGRMLGRGPWATFFGIALPLARPAVAAGAALAVMETLADFGTVQFYGVPTFTTAIYRTWFGEGQRGAAVQLAAVLLLLVFAALALERASRGRARYDSTRRLRPIAALRLAGLRGWIAAAICAAPILLGFAIPFLRLADMALAFGDPLFSERVLRYAVNSLLLAGAAAAATAALALVLAYGARLSGAPWVRASVRVATGGYVMPGSVIAVGILVPLAAVDAAVAAVLGGGSYALLTGGVVALVGAYVVRFLAVAVNAVEAGLARVTPAMDAAARTLGRTPGGVLWRVHLPLVWGSVLTAAILVFVDTLKELPATLLIRPFDFDTLAVRVFQMASDERLGQASTGAVAIVLVGLVPVVLMSRLLARSRPGGGVAPH